MLQKSFLLIISFLLFFPLTSAVNTDGLALLALKSAITSDPTRALFSWSESDPTPCHWRGIFCTNRTVTSIFLPNKTLSGYIPSELGLLRSLTRLTLSHNNFSKTIPPSLCSSTNLRYLDLSHNSLSGPIPQLIQNLKSLTHLDLSSNSLNGTLPPFLINLKSLTGTLNLSYNQFSGEIPESYGQFPVFVSLDLRNNNLTGKVPLVGSLINQGPTAFAGNPNLCGFPLQIPCPEAVNVSAGEQSSVHPEHPSQTGDVSFGEKENSRNGSVAVPLISGVSVVVGAVSLSVWLFRKKFGSFSDKTKARKDEKVSDNMSNNYTSELEKEGQSGKFVVVDEGFSLELEDLLRASAYVVGKSRSGIVYKVVVGGRSGGPVVAVRRLSESDATLRWKEFEAEVEGISRVHHPNIVRLKAYYFADDEKLLISDFIRNGSLYAALHGGPSDASPKLPWAARLKIAQGTARGLMFIHEYSLRKYVHGNLKSTKILLDDELQPYISGFGLTRLVSNGSKFTNSSSAKKHYPNQTIVTSAMGSRILAPTNMYLAPEARVFSSKFTQKSDVYSFGVVLMELLTGKQPDMSPENDGKGLENLVRKVFREERPLSEIIDPALLSEVHAKKQVTAVFHIALNCTEQDPEFRPRMRSVSENLDRIRLQ